MDSVVPLTVAVLAEQNSSLFFPRDLVPGCVRTVNRELTEKSYSSDGRWKLELTSCVFEYSSVNWGSKKHGESVCSRIEQHDHLLGDKAILGSLAADREQQQIGNRRIWFAEHGATPLALHLSRRA
eukprot:COSAG02_NODE_2994_length_7586_cov_3.858822_5_plen_126_part_00